MEEDFLVFVGIDCSTDDYQVCLLDAAGKMMSERTVPHSGSGISQFLDWLAEQTPQAKHVAVAIENPRGGRRATPCKF